jgi:hypothetical protein
MYLYTFLSNAIKTALRMTSPVPRPSTSDPLQLRTSALLIFSVSLPRSTEHTQAMPVRTERFLWKPSRAAAWRWCSRSTSTSNGETLGREICFESDSGQQEYRQTGATHISRSRQDTCDPIQPRLYITKPSRRPNTPASVWKDGREKL